MDRPASVEPPPEGAPPQSGKLAWRRPTLRRMDALDAKQHKGRMPHDFLHLS